MRGHEAIIRMRLKRKVPAIVFVNDYPCMTDWEKYADHATVCVSGDSVSALDLRFLTGLRVSISSPTEERARELFERVKAVNPELVGSCHVQPDVHPVDQSGWVGVWSREEVAHG
jgi:hypothetical protein